jgi:hypothetical protein
LSASRADESSQLADPVEVGVELEAITLENFGRPIPED